MRKIQRRDFLKAMGLATAALGLTACGGSGAASASSVSSAPASSSSAPSASAQPESAEDKAVPAGPPVTQFQTGELIIGDYTFKAQYSFAFVSLRRMKSCPEVFFYPVLRPFPPNGFTPHCDGRGALSGPPDPPCRRIGGGTTGYGADGLAAGNPRFCIGKVRRKRG